MTRSEDSGTARQNVPTPRQVVTPPQLDKVVPHHPGGQWPKDQVTTPRSPQVIRRGENAATATYQECTGYTFLINSMKRPRLVRLENGQLILLAKAWLYKTGEEDGILLTSDDEGESWSQPREVDFHGQLVALGDSKVGVVGGRMPLSEDGGKTWSTPDVEVSMPNRRSSEEYHGSVTFDGKRIAAVGYYEAEPRPPVMWTAYSVLRFSNDLGRSWGDPIALPAEWQTSEGALTYARDNALVAALRTAPNPTLLNALPDSTDELIGYNDSWRRLTTARTVDAGKTWTDVQVHFRFGTTHSELITLPNGDILLTYAARISELDGQIYRGIEAVISHDHGKTWDWANRFFLFRWNMQQSMHSPQSVVLSDGRIMTVFLYHYDASWGKRILPEALNIGMVDALFWKP